MTISAEFCDVFPTCSRLARPKSFFYLCRCLEIAPADVGILTPPCIIYMAIIRSAAIGTARGSLGIITYRTVRGRTIGSQKRGGVDPSTRAEGDTLTQFVFGLMARYASARSEDIKNAFSETKYGSARNAFMKLNYNPFVKALSPLYQTGMKASYITDEELDNAVHTYAAANPMEIVRAKLDGEPIVYLSGVWDSNIKFGRMYSASIGGTTLSDGVTVSSFAQGASVKATLKGFEDITLIEEGMFVDIAEDGDVASTVVQCTGVTVTKKGDDYEVAGTLASAIAEATNAQVTVSVRHSEGIGELTNKVYNNVTFKVEGGGTGSNPL